MPGHGPFWGATESAAIRFGDRLTLDACQRIVAQLALCDFPFQCAHGRPSMIPLATLPGLPDRALPGLAPMAPTRLNFAHLHVLNS